MRGNVLLCENRHVDTGDARWAPDAGALWEQPRGSSTNVRTCVVWQAQRPHMCCDMKHSVMCTGCFVAQTRLFLS